MYTHDYLFDADRDDPYRKIWTLDDMEQKAKQEDLEPEKRTLAYHLSKQVKKEKAKTWFDKLLDKIYE